MGASAVSFTLLYPYHGTTYRSGTGLSVSDNPIDNVSVVVFSLMLVGFAV